MRQISRPPQDRHAFVHKFRVAGVHSRKRNPKGELDRRRTGNRISVIAYRPLTARSQRQKCCTDPKADPVLTICFDGKFHNLAVERARFLESAAQKNGVVEGADFAQAHVDVPLFVDALSLPRRVCARNIKSPGLLRGLSCLCEQAGDQRKRTLSLIAASALDGTTPLATKSFQSSDSAARGVRTRKPRHASFNCQCVCSMTMAGRYPGRLSSASRRSGGPRSPRPRA